MESLARQEPLHYSDKDCARQFQEGEKLEEERGIFEVDRARIIHSAAFRRLQGKTQVFMSGSGDFFRTRLTHSLETAQIGKGLALRLGANTDLLETICLAHDLGHPPFGHTGEGELALCMAKYGGFEGNAQNLRLINFLSVKHPQINGLNLTRATIDGILKYKQPFSSGNPKYYYDDDKPLIDWATSDGLPGKNSFECQIMNWADDIAYSVHDLEDGMQAGLITTDRLLGNKRVRQTIPDEDLNWLAEKVRMVEAQPSERARKAASKDLTSRLIHEFVIASERVTVPNLPDNLSVRYRYQVEIDPVQEARCHALKQIMFRLIVEDPRIASLENKAERIVRSLFEVFADLNPRTLFFFPEEYRELWELTDDRGKIRVACDYIAGMTDDYAERLYARFYLPNAGSIYSMY